MQRRPVDWCAQDKTANAISQLVILAETLGKLGQEHAEQVPDFVSGGAPRHDSLTVTTEV